MDATTTSKTVPTAHEQEKQDGRVAKLTKQDASLSEQMTSLSEQITSLSKRDDSLSEQITSLSRKGTSLSEKPTGLSEQGVSLSGKDASLSEQDGGSAELTHDELMEVTSTALNDLLKSVTILADLPQDVTLEEVNAQIAVQHGQSITVYAVREDGEEIAAVVNQKGAKVIDLKHAIRRAVDLKVKRAAKSGEKRKISWKYVWKTNQLCFEGERLTSDQALLADLGVRNKARVTFVKRLREKGTVVR